MTVQIRGILNHLQLHSSQIEANDPPLRPLREAESACRAIPPRHRRPRRARQTTILRRSRLHCNVAPESVMALDSQPSTWWICIRQPTGCTSPDFVGKVQEKTQKPSRRRGVVAVRLRWSNFVPAGTRRRQPNCRGHRNYAAKRLFWRHGAASSHGRAVSPTPRHRRSGKCPQSNEPNGQPVEITPTVRRFHRQALFCVPVKIPAASSPAWPHSLRADQYRFGAADRQHQIASAIPITLRSKAHW